MISEPKNDKSFWWWVQLMIIIICGIYVFYEVITGLARPPPEI